MKFKITIPDEIVEVIEELGYDPKSWLRTQIKGLDRAVERKAQDKIIGGLKNKVKTEKERITKKVKVEDDI